MSEAWKQLDLHGAGLQRANLELSRRLKRRGHAWALLVLAPLGLHRSYLEDRAGAWLWRTAGAALVIAGFWDFRAAISLGAGMLAAAGYDAWWVDRRVTALNKRLRREVFLAGEPPPPGYAGRVPEEPGRRAPSFAEQEQLLRELARRRAPDEPGQEPGEPPRR